MHSCSYKHDAAVYGELVVAGCARLHAESVESLCRIAVLGHLLFLCSKLHRQRSVVCPAKPLTLLLCCTCTESLLREYCDFSKEERCIGDTMIGGSLCWAC